MENNSSSLRSYYPYWNRWEIPANGRCHQASRQRNKETSYRVLSLRMGLGTSALLIIILWKISNSKCSLSPRVKSGCKSQRNTNWQWQRKLIHGKKNQLGRRTWTELEGIKKRSNFPLQDSQLLDYGRYRSAMGVLDFHYQLVSSFCQWSAKKVGFHFYQ